MKMKRSNSQNTLKPKKKSFILVNELDYRDEFRRLSKFKKEREALQKNLEIVAIQRMQQMSHRERKSKEYHDKR